MTTEEDLRRLAALRDGGELSPAEYEQAVAMAAAEPRRLPPISQLERPTTTQPSFSVPFTPAAPPAPPQKSWAARNPWAFAVAGLIGVAVIWSNAAGAPQRALEELAADTCEQLDDAIVLQVGYILGDAIDDAEDLGFSAPELGDEMRATCPAMMTAVDSIGSDY